MMHDAKSKHTLETVYAHRIHPLFSAQMNPFIATRLTGASPRLCAIVQLENLETLSEFILLH